MRSKVTLVFVKSCKNATEQHYYGHKINKNDGTQLECALNSLNVNYLINYSSFYYEDKQ